MSFWTTRDGTVLRIIEMKTSHIKNAIEYFSDAADCGMEPDGYYDLIDELNYREQSEADHERSRE